MASNKVTTRGNYLEKLYVHIYYIESIAVGCMCNIYINVGLNMSD